MNGPETGAAPDDPLVSLNFLVHRDFRRRIKRRAVDAGITQKELLYQAIEAWEQKHGAGAVPYGGVKDDAPRRRLNRS